MKILKWIGVILLIVIAFFGIIGIIAPKEFSMSRSIIINSDKANIYRVLADFKRMIEWSPWVKLDPACKYEYNGNAGEVGHSYTWKGNKNVGSGTMTLTEVKPEEQLSFSLKFIEPFESESDGKWILKDTTDGTFVTWTFHTHHGFVSSIFMFFMNMEKMLGADYEEGLASLKEVVENAKPVYEVKEVTFTPTTYIGKRVKVPFSQVDSSFFSDTYSELGAAMAKNKAQMTGAPVSIAYSWNMATQMADIAPAFPVANDKGNWTGFNIIKITNTRALCIDYYGPYNQTDKAHAAMDAYIKDNNLNVEDYVIEEYTTDPGSVNYDYNKVLTRIFYFPK
jgi:effector-binding domain-containing protein